MSTHRGRRHDKGGRIFDEIEWFSSCRFRTVDSRQRRQPGERRVDQRVGRGRSSRSARRRERQGGRLQRRSARSADENICDRQQRDRQPGSGLDSRECVLGSTKIKIVKFKRCETSVKTTSKWKRYLRKFAVFVLKFRLWVVVKLF